MIDYVDDYLFDGCYVLIAEDGENLRSKKKSIATLAEGHFWVNNHAHVIQGNQLCETKYLFYLLNSFDFSRYITGTTQPKLSQRNLLSIEVSIPERDCQLQTIRLLDSIDSLILQDQKANDYLAELEKTLYKRFLSENAGEMREGILSELIDVHYGKDHKKLGDGPVPVYGSGGLMRKVESSLYEGESVLIPRKGSLNNVMYVNEPFWTVDTMFYAIPKYIGAARYVYEFLHEKDLASMNAGSAVPSMTTDILNNLQMPIPSQEALSVFDNQVESLFRDQKQNSIEGGRLVQLRDALLPKLMSGEIDVSKVDITRPNNHLCVYV